MTLEVELLSLDAVPEPLRAYYEPAEDGRYRLPVAGVVPLAEHGKLRAENEKLRAEAAQMTLDAALQSAAAHARVLAAAIPDITNRGRALFKVADGKVVPKAEAGQVGDPARWVESLRHSAPHLFAPSHGGGAPGNGAAPSAVRTISWGDQAAISNNLAAIAAGKIVLRD